MTRIARSRRDEEGAVLLAALIFVTICSLVVAALLGFADTDFRTTIAVREQRQESYAADAAVESAIRFYQQNDKCPDATTTFTPPGSNDVAAGDITVSCTADGSNAGSTSDAPQYAILTRGAAADDGIRAVSGAVTPARGGVFSEGRVEITSGARMWVVSGDVTVKGNCTGQIDVQSPGTKTCNYPGASPTDPSGIDQAPAVPSAVPTARTAPACPGDGSPIVLQPGTYTDLNGLKALTTSCSSDVIHLATESNGDPGFFYFNFAGGGDWTIGQSETVVGGTLTAPLASIASKAAGEKCDEEQQGVQLIFSGESRMSLASGGTMELCPPRFSAGTTQRVSVYGPALGATTPVTLSNLLATDARSTGNPVYTTPTNALADDGNAASATMADNKSAKLTVSQFAVPAIPAGATLTSVKLTVEHRETASPLSAVGLTADVSGGSGASSASTTITTFTKDTAWRTETFDLSSTFNTVSKLTNLSVAINASNPRNSGTTYTQEIDVVSLSVTYTPAVVGAGPFAPQSGCVVTGSTCPLVKTQGNASFVVKGTIYAPLSMLNIQLVGPTYQVFGRGVIIRRLDTDFTASNACNLDPLPDTEEYDRCYAFQLPRNRTVGDNVVFTATVRGRTMLRAYVNFTGASPVVKQWSAISE